MLLDSLLIVIVAVPLIAWGLLRERVAPSIFRNRGRHIGRVVRKIAGVAE